ncbi:MAG: DUF5320 domain-containing protein [Spirochaetota bacterium]|nr:DUF5320 domain-containing protein [Spirochaetota bacterium]
MPRGDGTGPAGFGPMTGRAAGHCAGYGMPGYMNPLGGRGVGGRGYYGGGGRGRGFRHMFYATGLPGWMRFGYVPGYGEASPYVGVNPPITQENEEVFLREQADYFQSALDDINKRLNELEKAENE